MKICWLGQSLNNKYPPQSNSLNICPSCGCVSSHVVASTGKNRGSKIFPRPSGSTVLPDPRMTAASKTIPTIQIHPLDVTFSLDIFCSVTRYLLNGYSLRIQPVTAFAATGATTTANKGIMRLL